MPTPFPVPFRVGIAPILLVLNLLAGGCASDDVSPQPPGRDASRQAPLPTMAGQQTFFEGRIVADVKVGAMAGFKPGPKGAEAEAVRGDGPPGRHREGFGTGMGGGMAGMGGTPPGGGGGPPPGGRVGPGGFEGGPPPGGRPHGMPSSPPVMIHLRFTNTGTEKVEVVIADFLSPLGNFVTFPDRLTLEPGQSAEVAPMTSRLAGQVTGGEITLRLKLGDRQETKTVTLKPETPAAAPAPAPAS